MSKSQWLMMGKVAGWTYHMCAYCGNPIDKPDGMADAFCDSKKCKIHNSRTPDDDIAISDGICQDCMDKEIPFKDPSQFPYFINKGETPKDQLISHIEQDTGRKQLSQEELNEIFRQNVTSGMQKVLQKNS